LAFFNPSQFNLGLYLSLSHDFFHPHPSRFIIHYHFIILRYKSWSTGIVVKLTRNESTISILD
jgi:hypothetical protein